MKSFPNLKPTLLLGLVLLSSVSVTLGQEDVKDEGASEEEVEKAPSIPQGPQYGPTLFYDEKNFLLQVTQGIKVHVFAKASEGSNRTAGESIGVVYMDKATSLKGSMINDKDFSVTIDWKDESTGYPESLKVGGLVLKMIFTADRKEYRMISLEVAKIEVNGDSLAGSKLQVTTGFGYKVEAPNGLAFCCTAPGMFAPSAESSDGDGKYKIGITFPDMKLQVYNVPRAKFGPSWYCGEIFSIGFWVGILITLFFTAVCYWGFGMLAAINTMDRFDDPKGKPIHVPTGE